MKKERLVAFFDAVIAIVMTVLVLELPKIHGTSFQAIWENRIHYFAYITTFILFVTFWDTHHTIFDKVRIINPKIVKIQMLLLFFDTLFPYVTSWVSENPYSYTVECIYMLFLLAANLSYTWLCNELLKTDSENKELRQVINKVSRHKITTILEAISLILGLINPIFILITCFFMLLMWYIPKPKKIN